MRSRQSRVGARCITWPILRDSPVAARPRRSHSMSQPHPGSGCARDGGGPVRIGLVVDHPRRDLDGLVLLALALLARGARPVLVPMYQQGLEQALLRLDAIVVNYYRPNNAQILRRWRAEHLATFVLDTEGGVLSEAGHD